jgi:hypothetical protein
MSRDQDVGLGNEELLVPAGGLDQRRDIDVREPPPGPAVIGSLDEPVAVLPGSPGLAPSAPVDAYPIVRPLARRIEA